MESIFDVTTAKGQPLSDVAVPVQQTVARPFFLTLLH